MLSLILAVRPGEFHEKGVDIFNPNVKLRRFLEYFLSRTDNFFFRSKNVVESVKMSGRRYSVMFYCQNQTLRIEKKIKNFNFHLRPCGCNI